MKAEAKDRFALLTERVASARDRAACSLKKRIVDNPNPTISATATAPTATNTPLFRRTNFRKRYAVLGGRATTGSLPKCRWMSAARPLAVS